MRRLALMAAVCAWLAAGADRKQVEALVQQVRDATGAEPALLSVDTLIRLAAVTVKLHPRMAMEAARDAGSLLLTLPDPETRGQFGVRLTEVLRQIDPEAARRYAMSMEPRQASGIYRDTKAEALDFVVRYWIPRDRKRAVEVLTEGLGAGAFRAESARELMEMLTAEDPAAAPGLFAVLLAAFPAESATDRDCLLLLRRAAQVAPVDSALAVEAARRVLRALESKKFAEDPEWRIAGQYVVDGAAVSAEDARHAIQMEAGALLAAFDPEAYKQYGERFGVDLAAAKTITAPAELKLSPRHPEDREDSPLAELMMREGPAAPSAGSPVERALEEAEADPVLYRRLWVYEGLLPNLWQHGNRALAAKAGQAMASTAARFCKCQDRACGSLRERAECLSANQRVAEDLYNFEIAPEDLGIGDPSLRARSLLLKLKDLAPPAAAK